MRLFLGTLACCLALSTAVLASGEALSVWDIPLNHVSSQTMKTYARGSVQVEELYYQSRPYKGKPVKIFGYLCYPKGAQSLPAILLVHGGGGSASLGRASLWAKRGYTVFAIDLPGKGERRECSRSTGPDMDVPILLRTKPSLEYNYLVHAVAAARNAITYLTQRKEVDPQRIWMVGLSWGGVITLLTNGQDDRLKTAVNVFGAGYIPEGCTWQDRFFSMSNEELSQWYASIDPKNFLKTQHAPILFMTGTNDHCYYLPTFQKSYDEVTVPKKLLLLPNLRHQFLPYMQEIVWRWLDNYLKGGGSFPDIQILAYKNKGNGKLIIESAVGANSGVADAKLYYNIGLPSGWTTKQWKGSNGYFENGVYYFSIPTKLISPEILFYLSIKDNKGGVSTTAIRSIMRVKMPYGNETFAISSPIKKLYMHEKPFDFVGLAKMPQFKVLWYSKADKKYRLVN